MSLSALGGLDQLRLKEQSEGAKKKKKSMLSVPENWWKQTEMKTYHNCPVNHENKGGSSSKIRLVGIQPLESRKHASVPASRLQSESQIKLTSQVDLTT